MDRSELSVLVRTKIASVMGVAETEVTEQTDLREEYQVDSLELMEIGARLESALGVRIKVDALLEMENVGDAVDALHRLSLERA
ncbi:acyl carrier protein [Microbispora sp. NPDC049125]|uniref:acyl carrier protein n=1 Tax=Microbispora sp. NPDC049125 TaxID=3154929 RepID=UPI003466D12C